MAPRKRLSPKILMLGGMGLALATGAVVSVVERPLPTWAASIVVLAALTFSAAIFVGWSRMDEAAREAHKWAWYWGGSAGLALAGAFTGYALREDPGAWTFPRVGSGEIGLVATGILLCVALQTAGYVVAWAFWWLSRR